MRDKSPGLLKRLFVLPALVVLVSVLPLVPRKATASSIPTPQLTYYHPLFPTRICDTRYGNPSNLTGPYAQCNGHEVTTTPMAVQVTGLADIPSSASAVVMNVTVTGSSAPGYVVVYPAGTSEPLVLNVNFTAGETVANLAQVKLSSSGEIDLASSTPVQVILDVEGYFSSSGNGRLSHF
jgi:hypothetical protein